MKEIFVFGSNLAGRHGAGAAKEAYKKHGARYGMGVGHYGCSYAIPTKDQNIETMAMEDIKTFVEGFILYAAAHPEWDFKVTRVGCGLAGIPDQFMANLFVNATGNCMFDEAWKPYLGEQYFYWGTYG